MSELTPDDLREFMKRLEQWDRFTGGGFADAWQSQLTERDKRIAELEAAIATLRGNPITKNQFAMFEELDK